MVTVNKTKSYWYGAVITINKLSVEINQTYYDNRDNLKRLQFIIWDTSKVKWED